MKHDCLYAKLLYKRLTGDENKKKLENYTVSSVL